MIIVVSSVVSVLMTPEILAERRRNTFALCMCILYLGTGITLLLPFVFILFMEAVVPRHLFERHNPPLDE